MTIPKVRFWENGWKHCPHLWTRFLFTCPVDIRLAGLPKSYGVSIFGFLFSVEF